jgi:ketosteroid isomerase-like protein
MVFKLPKLITNYLDADKAKDADRLALCFAGDALVHDEGRDYRGRDAIRSWKQESKGKYT